MCILKLQVFLIVLSVALNHLKATPIESHQVEKRKCNTATCATQRLANFLVRSSNNFGSILSSTNVGSNTYGKRNALKREPLNYLPL
ncbi:islet amyloid polypeptide [Rhinopithecus roxellana]|uniref:Islet amyloid polypeptide n=2 Tax=Rhinopithecus TaxID=542827 RepID=A0A2K6K7Z4_RHIBE|nr:PREDICTED: islet amyloid polypeptide [Rhinopithecus bieti]XP_030795545.1 islet amyloid polypeptide [Rhinopithecus roxellana]XP_033078598.1 islet amyloid polypeptide [Trachypithecus francoisi]